MTAIQQCVAKLRERRGTIPGLIEAIEAKKKPKPKAAKPRKPKKEKADGRKQDASGVKDNAGNPGVSS